jgi:hypothetical protein
VKTAPFSMALFLATGLGCNSILGIDAAQLEPADAGTDAPAVVEPQTDAGAMEATTSDGATCTLRRSTDCNTCVAQNCCVEYEACNADKNCKQGLIDYAFCLGNNFTSDAGASCDEDFIGKAGKLSLDLAQCAFVDKCVGTCRDQTIGDDLCTTYCTCMQSVCGDHPFEAGSCTDHCRAFDANQLVCRPYHCNLAKITMADESKRTLHCGHASGNTPCH